MRIFVKTGNLSQYHRVSGNERKSSKRVGNVRTSNSRAHAMETTQIGAWNAASMRRKFENEVTRECSKCDALACGTRAIPPQSRNRQVSDP